MNLVEKIMTIYPTLTIQDFMRDGTIVVVNMSDEKGDFIKEWNHPDFPQPTEAQLNAITG